MDHHQVVCKRITFQHSNQLHPKQVRADNNKVHRSNNNNSDFPSALHIQQISMPKSNYDITYTPLYIHDTLLPQDTIPTNISAYYAESTIYKILHQHSIKHPTYPHRAYHTYTTTRNFQKRLNSSEKKYCHDFSD
jgi:hypothetical protein